MINSSQIASIVGGVDIQVAQNIQVRRLLLDSRKIANPEGSMFIAIKGERHDGNRFLKEVYDAGVRNFLVERADGVDQLTGANVVQVKSAIEALQKLAEYHRAQFNIPVIGITGSNGKTSVKEWLNTLLAYDFQIVRSPKSWNSQIGVPLSVWNMEENHSLGIFEAGISKPNEMKGLANVIQPTIGILTNIGTTHLENFSSREELIEEKLCLFSDVTILIIPDDEMVKSAVKKWKDKQIIVVPEQHTESPKTPSVNVQAESGVLYIDHNDETLGFRIAMRDDAALNNAAICVAALLALNYSADEIQQRLERLCTLEMRLQLLRGEGNSIVVNDAYSNDLQSFEIALDFLNQHAHGRKKVVVLSDVLQSGLDEKELHARILSLMQSKSIDSFVGIGKSMMSNSSRYPSSAVFFESTEKFLQSANAADYAGMALLVKGARDFRFERIVSMLQQQTHDTVLEINLNALVHNLNYFKAKLKPEVKLMVMVKAMGYGAGSREVASLLEFNKADYLAVAYTDEGVELRKSGISLPVMVMNPERNSLDSLIRHHLEPEIYSMRSLLQFLQALSLKQNSHTYPVHIKLDTGMHRLGFEQEELDELISTFNANKNKVKIASVFTHLAATEEPQHDAFTEGQLALFDKMSQRIKNETGHVFLRHALNTGGIQRFPKEAQYDMVRLGIGLYGVAAHPADQSSLLPVGTLKTIISQIKKIAPGESVGYSRKFVAEHDTTIATIPLGYADGISRKLGNRNGQVSIHNSLCDIVGNVCMDMLMVDITHTEAQEGDEVIVFGKEISLTELAQKCGTIPYEILTSISGRVKRVYVEE